MRSKFMLKNYDFLNLLLQLLKSILALLNSLQNGLENVHTFYIAYIKFTQQVLVLTV